MSVLDNIMARMGYTKAPAARPGSRLYTHDDVFSIPGEHLPRNQAELMQRLSWVNIAVTRVAQTAAGTPLAVKRITAGEEPEDIPAHPFEIALDMPNELMSRFEFLEATFAFRALTGNAYWWLNKGSESAPPVEMWIIPPDRMKPVPDGRLGVKGYLYDPGFGQPEIPLEAWEVVHFKTFHPTNPYVGLSPIEALVSQAVGDMKASEWNAAFFSENNAKMPGALAFADPIDDATWTRMQAEFKRNYGGSKRNLMMLRGVGEGAVSWIPMAMSQSDMEFLAGRNFTKEEIYAVFAPGLASMLAVNSTEASATAGRATFLEQAIYPVHQAVSQKISNTVLRLYGDNLRAEFEDVRMTDRALELEEIKIYALTHRINEIRRQYYGDDELQDERGELFVAEIGISGSGPTGEVAEEMGDDDRPTPGPQEVPGSVDDEQKPSADKAAKAEPMPEPETTMEDELAAWQRKAVRRVKEGKAEKALEFVSTVIPDTLAESIRGALEAAQDEADVKAAFAWGMYP